MRNPERIPAILEKLREVWECNPDLRLGQLLSKLADDQGTDVFYLEDDRLLAILNYENREKVGTF